MWVKSKTTICISFGLRNYQKLRPTFYSTCLLWQIIHHSAHVQSFDSCVGAVVHLFYHFVLKSLFTWSEQNRLFSNKSCGRRYCHGDGYILLLPYATDCSSISSSIRLNSQMIGSDKKVIDTFKLFYLTCFDPIWAYRDNTTKSGPIMIPIFKRLVRIY